MPVSFAPLEQQSLAEVLHLLRWYNGKPRDARQALVIVGGWAVYAHNPSQGSVDIDIVTSSRFRQEVIDQARGSRGFGKLGDRDVATSRVALNTAEGEILLDFALFSGKNTFEGNEEMDLRWRLVLENNRERRIGGELAIVPERGLLICLKAKAAHDRETRLRADRADRPDYELAKMIKDRADILALLDPREGAEDIDLALSGKLIAGYPPLLASLRKIVSDREAWTRYNAGSRERCEAMEASEWVRKYLRLTSG